MHLDVASNGSKKWKTTFDTPLYFENSNKNTHFSISFFNNNIINNNNFCA